MMGRCPLSKPNAWRGRLSKPSSRGDDARDRRVAWVTHTLQERSQAVPDTPGCVHPLGRLRAAHHRATALTMPQVMHTLSSRFPFTLHRHAVVAPPLGEVRA